MTIRDCFYNGHFRLSIREDNKVTLSHCCFRDEELDTKSFEEFNNCDILEWCSNFIGKNNTPPRPCINIKNDICDFTQGSKTVKCINVALSHVCNLKCPMCFMGPIHKDTPEMKKLYLNTLYKLKDQVPEIRLTDNGEPFFYKREMFEFFKSCPKSLTIHMTTNATLLSLKDIEFLANLDCKIDIAISLDAMTEATYKKIRGINAFNHVIRIIKLCSDYCILSNVNTTKQEDNLNELDQIRDFVNSLNNVYWSCYDKN